MIYRKECFCWKATGLFSKSFEYWRRESDGWFWEEQSGKVQTNTNPVRLPVCVKITYYVFDAFHLKTFLAGAHMQEKK